MFVHSRCVRRLIAISILLLTAFGLNSAWALGPETALDDYVNINEYDPAYSIVSVEEGDGYKLYVIYLVSQEWRDPSEVDRTEWTHWLAMIVPDQTTADTGMLIIAGGSNTSSPDLDAGEVAIGAQIAKSSGSVVSVIGQIPNQPLIFPDEQYPHSEDELVAYSFDKALDTGDWYWPVYLPMAKAAVGAMDVIETVTGQLTNGAMPVNQFVLTGFSKRGAATWLSAVVDPRVLAIAPGVYDILNMDEQVEHHFSAYGFYSDALDEYVDYNILRRIRTPEGQALMQVVDPISYKDRLTMPKFLINSTGDTFFPPDSARFYFDELEGENLIRYVPNTGHSLETASGSNSDAIASLVSWYLDIIFHVPLPHVSWHHTDGQLVVQTDRPAYARLWQANNPTARDFRLETFGRNWESTPLVPIGPGTYSVPVPVPEEGWTAYFVDLTFPSQIAGAPPQTYSTSIYVSPDTLPFEVTDPLLDPRGVGFWRRQVAVAQGSEGNAQVPVDILEGYLPIPLFDQYVTDVADAAAVFSAIPRDPQVRARQQCLALRLNVRDGQLGWYTSLTLEGRESMKLWQLYTEAHKAYLAGDSKTAQTICAAINAN